MSGRRLRPWLFAALVLAYVLHNDLWLWDDARLAFGLPVGLVYHIGFCVVVALIMAALARFAWPSALGVDEDRR